MDVSKNKEVRRNLGRLFVSFGQLATWQGMVHVVSNDVSTQMGKGLEKGLKELGYTVQNVDDATAHLESDHPGWKLGILFDHMSAAKSGVITLPPAGNTQV